MKQPPHLKLIQSESFNLLIVEDLGSNINFVINQSFHAIAHEVSANIMLSEVNYLYCNKIYDKNIIAIQSNIFDSLASDVDNILSKYSKLIRQDIFEKLSKAIQ